MEHFRTIMQQGSNFSHDTVLNARMQQKAALEKVKFTEREQQILELILQEKTSQDIAKILHLSKKTVDAHRANMMDKFGVKSTIGLIKILWEDKNNLL